MGCHGLSHGAIWVVTIALTYLRLLLGLSCSLNKCVRLWHSIVGHSWILGVVLRLLVHAVCLGQDHGLLLLGHIARLGHILLCEVLWLALGQHSLHAEGLLLDLSLCELRLLVGEVLRLGLHLA